MMKKKGNVPVMIKEQLKDVEGCLINFENFIRASLTPETAHETLRALMGGVVQMEAAADRSLTMMIESLAHTSLLPSTRQDLINIATSCDHIANKCETLAVLMVVQKFRFPEKYNEDVMKILEITRVQFELLEKAIEKMFTRFGDLLQDHSILNEIREEESKVDAIEQRLTADVFELDMDLAHQSQAFNFVDTLCDISDVIENIADSIQIMLITRKA